MHSWYATNVTITGGGVIDGGGAPWWACRGKPAGPCFGYSRPNLIMLVHSTDIVVSGVRLVNSPSWTLHFANCTNVVADGVAVTAPSNSPNTDGFDVDCSVNVTIQNCAYSGGDDAVAVKSGINWLGRTFGRATTDVVVRNMVVGTSHGLSVGSEMSAGVSNVLFDNITANGSSAGPHVKSCRGRGGVVSNITYNNVRTTNSLVGLYFTMNYVTGLPPTNATATPQVHNITVSNGVHVGAGVGVAFIGLPESVITGVTLSNVSFVDSVVFQAACTNTTGTCSAVTPSCPTCLSPVSA